MGYSFQLEVVANIGELSDLKNIGLAAAVVKLGHTCAKIWSFSSSSGHSFPSPVL